MKNKFCGNKGITLIALVITILVMLILAGISISMIVGEDGVISQAEEGKKKTEIAQITERVELVKQAILVDKLATKDSSVVTIERFRDDLLKEFNVEKTDENGDAIIDLNNPYSILLYSELKYKIVEKSKLYLAEEDENGWNIDGIDGKVRYRGEDKEEIIIPIKIGNKHIKTTGSYIAGMSTGSGNAYVKEVIIPDGITTIGNCTFTWAKKITDIMLPNSVKTIGENAFELCRRLKNITLPEGLILIGKSAFLNCESLETITIPSSVTTIGDNAFAGCSKLKTIYLEEGSTLTVLSDKWGASNVEIIRLGETQN